MRRRLLSVVFAIGLMACVPGVSAAGARSESQTMTVTAYRTASPPDSVGSAVSSIGREEIESRQATVSADALRWVPGIAVARGGPIGAQTQVRIRGAEANQALVLIDGVEANDPATDDAFSFEHLTTWDIERIEVVRGPQSALWGSDSLAGVINIVTRRASAPREAAAFLESGSFGLANGGARAGLRTDSASLTASVSRFQVDGTNASARGSEADAYDNTSGMLSGSYAIRPGLAVDAMVRHTDATAEFDALDYVNGVLVPVDADNHSDVRQTFARTGGRLDLLDGRWAQELHYAVSQTSTRTTAENLADLTDDKSRTNGDKYGIYYQSTLRLPPRGEGSAGDLLTFAIENEREEFSQRGEASFFGDPNQDQNLSTTGYALEYLAFIGDVAASASARHDDNSDFGDVNTWRTTLSWPLQATGSRLHGSLGTGQKAPTFFERFGFTPDTFVGNPDLEPETSTGWDAGIEQRWLQGRLVADLTYFHADLDNEINGFVCPPPTFACTAVNEPGESRRKGVEATLEAAFADSYTLSLAYTYTDATESQAQDDGTEKQTREVRRPLHAGSANVTGRWLDRRLTVNLGMVYTSARTDLAFLQEPPYFDRVSLGSYTLVSLAGSYAITPRLAAYARLDNALDADYEDVYGFEAPGTAAVVGLRMAMGR